MSGRRLYADYLDDMLQAMDAAIQFTGTMTEEQFVADQKTIYATTRALGIIADSVARMPGEIRARWPEIPWRRMAAMRGSVEYGYRQVDLVMTWNAVQHDIPATRPLVERALRDQEAREADA